MKPEALLSNQILPPLEAKNPKRNLDTRIKIVSLFQLFNSDKATTIALNGRDIAILEAVRLNPTGICAADVVTLIERETGKEPRLATVYNAILDMERKGLIKAGGTATGGNGGRPRRLYLLTPTGELALQLGEQLVGHQLELTPA